MEAGVVMGDSFMSNYRKKFLKDKIEEEIEDLDEED